MNLTNARILITGGSKGIGKAAANVLTDAGAKVMITARGEEKLLEAAKETGALPFVADVAKEADIDKTYSKLMDAFGGLDVLINNAGIGRRKPVEELEIEDFMAVYSVNVFGAAMMAKQAAKIFKAQNFGHIVNIASTAALKGYAGGSIYSSSKFALRSMTQAWQAELRKHNVRVIGINPSEVPTAFGQASGEERPEEPNKLTAMEIAHAIKAALEMDDRGYIPELTIHATNPF